MSVHIPQIDAEVLADGTGVLRVDGAEHRIEAGDVAQARHDLLRRIADIADSQGSALLATTRDPDGRSWRLLIDPTGNVAPAPPEEEPDEEPLSEPAAQPVEPPQPSHAVKPEHPARYAEARAGQSEPAAEPEPRKKPAVEPRAESAPAMQPSAEPEETFQRPRSTPLAPLIPLPERPPPLTAAAAPPPAWRQVIDDHNRAVQPVIAVLSCKGGVGTTTTAVGVGAALADLRGERVLALDANHFGDLADRLPETSGATLADLARDGAAVQQRGFTAMRYYLGHNGHGFHALGSGFSPTHSPIEYETAARLAEHYTDAVLTDCGTDIDHDPVLAAAVARSTRTIVVAMPSDEAVTAALQTLAWLYRHHPALGNSAVVALCQRTSRNLTNPAAAGQRLGAQGHPVINIPFDRHLAQGGVIDRRRLRRATRTAYTELAEAVITA